MYYYITNFYDLRFFAPNCIPVSTALGDPAYFHNNTKNKNYCFVDARGVMNGIREESLSPKYLPAEAHVCGAGCVYKDQNPNCPFVTAYRAYLNTINFAELIKELERTAKEVQLALQFSEEPCIVLLVHEAIDNPCSERWTLQDYFRANGIDLQNWSRELGGHVF